MTKRRPDRALKIAVAAFWIVVILALLGIALSVRLLMTGGDWGCVFSHDPQMCAAVKGIHGGL